MQIIELPEQETAVLLATRSCENAMSANELAISVQQEIKDVQQVLDRLVFKGILEPLENFGGVLVYGYSDNWLSQEVYRIVNQEKDNVYEQLYQAYYRPGLGT